MGVIWTIVLGFVIGLIAKLIHPGKENMGIITTIMIGVAGSFAGWDHWTVPWMVQSWRRGGFYCIRYCRNHTFSDIRKDKR